MLKYKADVKTVLFLIITSLLFGGLWYFGFQWTNPLFWIAYITFLYFEVTVAVSTHNHNHINIWTNKTLNVLTDWWLTIFYGLPIFVWIPTHNRNHHRYNNKLEDVTRTYRHTEHNDMPALLMYPAISGPNQMRESIIPYMKDLKDKNPEQWRENWTQLAVLMVWNIFWFVINWKLALIMILLPQQVSQLSVIVFNYVQHTHADEESDYNHSRNFMGVNPFLFNNGYHTIHHERASIHWSEAPEAHKKIEHLIAPHLIEQSFWWYMARTYVLAYFVPKYRTSSMRLERIEREKEKQQQAA